MPLDIRQTEVAAGMAVGQAFVVEAEMGRVLASASRHLGIAFPAPGAVEHDPEEIWARTLDAVADALGQLDPATSGALAAVATLGVLLGAVYMLWMVKRVFWGAANTDEDSGTARLSRDLNGREIAVLVPIVVLIFWMGLQPRTFLAASQEPVARLLEEAKAPAPRMSMMPAPEVKP